MLHVTTFSFSCFYSLLSTRYTLLTCTRRTAVDLFRSLQDRVVSNWQVFCVDFSLSEVLWNVLGAGGVRKSRQYLKLSCQTNSGSEFPRITSIRCSSVFLFQRISKNLPMISSIFRSLRSCCGFDFSNGRTTTGTSAD